MRYGRCAGTGALPMSYWRYIPGREVRGTDIFFAAKHFAIAKNLLTLHSKKKVLYNIVIQHKTAGDVIATDRTTTKETTSIR